MKKNYILTILTVFSLNSIYSQNNNFLNFDGTNDYTSTTLPSVFSDILNNDITIEAYIFPEVNEFSRVLFAQVSSDNFVSVSYTSQGSIILYVNNTISQQTPDNSFPLNQWNHFAVTWNSSTQEIQIYLNGVLQLTEDAGTSTSGTNNKMTIGSKTNQDQFFDGSIDELRIWNAIRTQTEISSNMNIELTLPQTNLVNYYKFNEGQAGADNTGVTTLNDDLSANNGELNNFTLNGNSSNWMNENTLKIFDMLSSSSSIKLFPNPAKDYIEISGLENTGKYKIINSIGTEIDKGEILNLEKIDIQNLSNGIYLLKFEDGNTVKFVKE